MALKDEKSAEDKKVDEAAKKAEQRANPLTHAQGENLLDTPKPDPAAGNEEEPTKALDEPKAIDQSDSSETRQGTTETYTTGQEDRSNDHATTIDPKTGHAVTRGELRDLEASRANLDAK
jgi:hypothetical protein